MNKALLIIDLQNDYFPDGKFPLWNPDVVLQKVEQAIAKAQAQNIPVILIQHVANASKGLAPFFNQATHGVEIHPRILAATPAAPIVIKEFADSFLNTTLETVLSQLKVDELIICGMMTQNCVTHTAISKSAEKYQVSVIKEACTTVSEILHLIALNALSNRVKLVDLEEAF